MFIKQLYTNCLAEAAYYIESNGEAAVIDPIRETAPYIQLAEERGAKIKYIFETHFHADFVSGHIDLAKKTGAKIIFGPGAQAKFEIYNAADNEVFPLGKISIQAIHTPGHTPESTSYLLLDENGNEHALFSGDALFVGDVGRPDLLDGVIISKEEQSNTLYDTLNNKIKTLPDHVIVYPGHGPGSMCGKSIGKETESTIGKEKLTNYALQPMSREEFMHVILADQIPAPKYFVKNAIINRNGYENIDEVMTRNGRALSVDEVKKEISAGALVIDARKADDFEKGFIKGAINIGMDDSFAVWAGTLIDINQRIIIVAEADREKEAILRLARVGMENVAGFLNGGIQSWLAAGEPIEKIESINADEFAHQYKEGRGITLDVRRVAEFNAGHLHEANNIPLRDLENRLNELNDKAEFLIHCAGGYRSMIAASIMKKHGFNRIINVQGGFNKIKETGLEIEKAVMVS